MDRYVRACSVSIGKVTNPGIRSSTYPPWGGETSRDGIDFSPDVSRDDSTGKVGEIVSSYETVRVLSSCEHGGTVSAGKVFSSGWSKLNNTLYSHGILNPSLYSRFRFHLFFFFFVSYRSIFGLLDTLIPPIWLLIPKGSNDDRWLFVISSKLLL